MIPDYLIYDELRRREDAEEWQPEPLHLPLYMPDLDKSQQHDHVDHDEEDDEPQDRGVIIIDMN